VCIHRRRVVGREEEVGEVAQMITWNVPPSTERATPLT
jgi:hypothetical protein